MREIVLFLSNVLIFTCYTKGKEELTHVLKEEYKSEQEMELATFAGGCFWCTEAIFLELEGILSVTPGYTGGHVKNPRYEQVISGKTGHAEAIQIVFNPEKISFGELLEIFFATHNPTTLNRQGNDIGTQYRSEIFYHSEIQKKQAETYMMLLEKEKVYKEPIVTRLSQAVAFYEAEEYHRNYYNQNTQQPYCHYIITPKIEKLRKQYMKKLKKN